MKRIYTVQHTQSEHHTNGIVEVFVDLWTNKIVGRFTKKKKSNPSSEIQ